MKTRAFTLIELLVVVLIIGILAAIAVPQYQKAVLKTKYHTLMNITKAVKDAQERYFLQNGEYAEHFSDLDITAPAGGIIGPIELKSVSGSFFNAEGMTLNDGEIIVAIPFDKQQVFGMLYIDNERAMDYNLRADNHYMWDGARAMCVSWPKVGTTGQNICKNLSTLPESCSLRENIGRYACRLYN